MLQVAALDVLPHMVKATCEGLIDAVEERASRASDSSPRRSQLPSPGPASSRARPEEHGASDAGRLHHRNNPEPPSEPGPTACSATLAVRKLRRTGAKLNVNGEPREGLPASIKLNGVRLSRRQIHSGGGAELDAVR